MTRKLRLKLKTSNNKLAINELRKLNDTTTKSYEQEDDSNNRLRYIDSNLDFISILAFISSIVLAVIMITVICIASNQTPSTTPQPNTHEVLARNWCTHVNETYVSYDYNSAPAGQEFVYCMPNQSGIAKAYTISSKPVNTGEN